jgi:hypothetical protein
MSDSAFVIVDVFSNRPLSGNPLPVFPRADGIVPLLEIEDVAGIQVDEHELLTFAKRQSQ